MDITGIEKRRQLIDRRALAQAVETLFAEGLKESARKPKLLALYKDALAKGQAEVQRRFFESHDGAKAVLSYAYLIDQLIRVIHDTASTHIYPAANPTNAEKLCILAVGGYGRGELAPYSDIDLLFVHEYKISPRVEQVVEEVLYTLWDVGLKVGHATRSVDECMRQAKADVTIKTAMLEARYVWGEKNLFAAFQKAFKKDVQAGTGFAFLEAKLAERDARHERMGDSRYVLEPNIKDGKGGLRDLHTLYWAAKYLYHVGDISELVNQKILTKAEATRFAKAQQYLWTLRCHLHYLTDRPEERLTFDVQPELARRMGYTDHAGTSGVERFMKHYFLIAKDVGDLTRIFCAAFEAQHQKKPLFSLSKLLSASEVAGFANESGRLNELTRGHFRKTPVDMLRIFKVAHENRMSIHPDALKSITRNLKYVNKKFREDPAANAIFMDILTSKINPEGTLRHMNECGLFGKFIPDFGRVVAQMQYDMYHVYTTDEHTIRAIGILNRIENGELAEDHPLATKLMPTILSREVLYVAVFLHDIAKGRGGDHSELGAEVARSLCPRLGLSEEQTETVAWLVLHHLAMSNTAFKRDIDDPKTVIDFVDLVQSPERLRLLLCLTVVDIRAVGPNVWNNWKSSLLRDMYYRAFDFMTEGLDGLGRAKRVTAARDRLVQLLDHWPDHERERHIDRLPDGYLLAFDAELLLRHSDVIREAELRQQTLALDIQVLSSRDATEITIFTEDHPGLFARLSGALAVCGASIVDARIATFKDGTALDVFTVQDAAGGGAFKSSSKLARLSVMVEQVLSGRVRPLEELDRKASHIPSRMEIFYVAPRVLIDNKASNTHTVIEVNGRDRPALVYRLTTALFRMGIQITSAKISTYGEQVVDVFYVKDVFGMKITHETKLKEIRQGLLDVLEIAGPGGMVGDMEAPKSGTKTTAKSPTKAAAKPASKTASKTSSKSAPSAAAE